MHNSYLERGLASGVKLKGGKDEVSVVKSFDYRTEQRHNKFTYEKSKEGCGISRTCMRGTSLRHAPQPSLN